MMRGLGAGGAAGRRKRAAARGRRRSIYGSRPFVNWCAKARTRPGCWTPTRRADLLGRKQHAPSAGVRTGKLVDLDSGPPQLLAVPETVRNSAALEDYCVLAPPSSAARCRRSELATLDVSHLQMQDDRWIIQNLRGKGGRVRSVAVPTWDQGRDRGLALRLRHPGRPDHAAALTLEPDGLGPDSIMEIVRRSARQDRHRELCPSRSAPDLREAMP